METEMQAFYKHKRIFITGGSGFLGKVVIEKLLRVTNVECIYMLIRAKKGHTVEERIAQLFKDPIFESLLKAQPTAAERVVPIVGDCMLQPALGISEADQALLNSRVHVIVHSAATVRFNELLSVALEINTRATQELLRLAKGMTQLQAFVHVSSAFANCVEKHIDEVYYTEQLPCTASKLLAAKDALGSELIDKLSDTLCGKFPNTYTYTKALSEDIVLTECGDLPICIFRPAIIINSYKEPVPGWIDNMYGPTGLIYGACRGVVRVMYVDIGYNAIIVPVDYCANGILACAWHMAKSETKTRISSPPIYNLVPSESNPVKWNDLKNVIEVHGPTMPLTKMMWFPLVPFTTMNTYYYKLLCFFLHIIPGYMADFCLLILGRKRFVVKVYEKIHKIADLISYFSKYKWSFNNDNTRQLWQSLSSEDQKLFEFEMHDIDWSMYLYSSLCGMRRFLGKDEPASIPQGVKLFRRLKILHHTTKVVIYSGGLALLWSCVSNFFWL